MAHSSSVSGSVRVRFAPSPTGALHIGGVRTALYNWLFARRYGGTFILRIEDTDQGRFVPGAEAYIIEALQWAGIAPDEGQGFGGGPDGPYRQSERRELYARYAKQLLIEGKAYYAFDTTTELEQCRAEAEAAGRTFIYNASTRHRLKNSLVLSSEEVSRRLEEGEPYVVRLQVDANREVSFVDYIRGEVRFHTAELDDKVLLKADGLPTYHLANVVDDHLMRITHVIRGEEWLPSTPTHWLLYEAFGWQPPVFAHLPLIMKPNGKGKLSKRDGRELGIPVFPMDFELPNGEQVKGFRELGFSAQAMLNFLAFLGWSPEDDREIYSPEELVAAFSLERVHKAGARFDYQKALWFSQQHLLRTPVEELVTELLPLVRRRGFEHDRVYVARVVELMRERCSVLTDFVDRGYYLFGQVRGYDEKATLKLLRKWQDLRLHLGELPRYLVAESRCFAGAEWLKPCVEAFVQERGLSVGDVLPVLRLAVSGTLQGPDLFGMMCLLGAVETERRLLLFLAHCEQQSAG